MEKENKNYPVLAIVLTLVALFLAVISASMGLFLPSWRTAGVTPFALLEIVASVLFLAGLTTGKKSLIKTITIIVTVALTVVSFSLVLINLNTSDYNRMFKALLFALSLLMLISSVLEMIYYFNLRNERIKVMYKIASYAFFAIIAIYAVAYIANDLITCMDNARNASNAANEANNQPSLHIYFLTLSLAALSLIPMIANFSAVDNGEPDDFEE